MGSHSQNKKMHVLFTDPLMEISLSTNHVQFIECKNLKEQIYTSTGMSQKQIISVESTNIRYIPCLECFHTVVEEMGN